MPGEIETSIERARENTGLLGSALTVPRHVVYRTFPSETVVLNLNTGRYHGLNVTAGRVLTALEASATVRDAVGRLAHELRADPSVVRRDVCDLCRSLLERGLVEIDDSAR